MPINQELSLRFLVSSGYDRLKIVNFWCFAQCEPFSHNMLTYIVYRIITNVGGGPDVAGIGNDVKCMAEFQGYTWGGGS